MDKEDLNIFIESEEIKTEVDKLGQKISEDYKGKKPILIGVLNGTFIFLADLIRSIKTEIEIDFIKISSYRKGVSNNNLILVHDINSNIKKRDIIIVEDIIDTGTSVEFLKNHLLTMEANSLKICTLINKTGLRKVNIDIGYSCFEIESDFIVGYGMDYNGLGRNLSDIYVLEKD